MRHNSSLITLALILLCAAACGHSDTAPSNTSTANISGNWSGPLSVDSSAATMTWDLTESPGSNVVTGTVVVALANGVVLFNGALSGTFDGSNLPYTIVVGAGGIPSQPSCTGQLSGTAAETGTTTLNGTYSITASSCTAPIQGGPFTLTKS